MSPKVASSCDQSCASSGKTLAGEKPKAARTLLYGRGSRLALWSLGKLYTISTQRLCLVVLGSEINRRGPAVSRAAAKAAEEKRFSGQYTTAEVGRSSARLHKLGRGGPER